MQVLHNVELALDVFRRLPRDMNGRHLFSTNKIAKGDDVVRLLILFTYRSDLV